MRPSSRNSAALLAVFAAIALGGCATQQPSSGAPGTIASVHALASQADVADARASAGRTRPWLRWNAYLTHRLEQLEQAPDENQAAEVVSQAAALARAAARDEALRLPGTRTERQALAERAAADGSAREQEELAAVHQAAASHQLAAHLRVLQKDIEPSVKERGRTARTLAHLPLAPFNWAWLGWHVVHEYRGPNDVNFERVHVWAPPTVSTVELGLLARHAPVIAQDWPAASEYPETADRIGAVTLAADGGGGRVEIDTRRPTVYAYESTAILHGKEHRQLVYTWWYPEHPPGQAKDPEAGRIEGVTLRITLDSQGEPAIYETVYNCGCYHRVFLTELIEAKARERFGEPLPGKRFAVEANSKRRIDLVVPELFHTLGGTANSASPLDQNLGGLVGPGAGRAPVVFTFARFHMIGAVRPLAPTELPPHSEGSVTYELRPYSDLEHLPLGDGFGSMFEPNGLVRGAERREGFLLGGLGMLSAGQPRQRGTQQIHFDQYDFDDPTLLEQFLRLPEGL